VGRVARAQFTAAAERAGLAAVLDDYVLNQVCADADALTAAYGLESKRSQTIAHSALNRADFPGGSIL
jgi:hypothetical protein